MKKNYLSLLLLPLLLTSCGSGASFESVKARIDGLSSEDKYPYYRVIGSMDFNNELLEIDQVFDQTPGVETFVPYSRYNDGFYNATLDSVEPNKDDVLIYGMASRSYWLRAPLRITSDNFYAEVDGRENRTCAHYIISHIITSYMDQSGSINPSKNVMGYELLSDGGFAFIGGKVHTTFKVDNYPYYPDFDLHPELDEWDEDDPLPCYKNSVNAKVNVRLEYNAEGWLVKESLASLDYDYNVSSDGQISLHAEYIYRFS